MSVKNKKPVSVKGMNFDQIFHQISPEEISDNVFTLVGKDYFIITAGREAHYNSMTGSGGGLGMLFKKPTTWCVLRADRYTLELIQKERPIQCLISRKSRRSNCTFWEVNRDDTVIK